MKKIGPVIMLLALLVGGYFVYTSVLGGSVGGPTKTPGVPTDLPDLPDPDDAVDTGTEGAQDGANWLADFLTGLSPTTWKFVGIFMIVAAVVWVIKNPKRLAIALGVVVVGLLVMLIG
jgi:hypothetical protein